MTYTTLTKLIHTDFDIRNITVNSAHFADNCVNDYSQTARNKNLLHLVTNGTRKYEIDGQEFLVSEGTLILIPDKTFYISRVCNQENGCDGVGICFDLFLQNGDKIYLEPGIYHNWNSSPDSYLKFFQNLQDCYADKEFSILRAKSLMYRFLYHLSSDFCDISPSYALIEPAVNFIAGHYQENHSIQEYADCCKLSESYFRKKFLECMGMTSIDYRNKLRFAQARRLYQENYSIQEISEMLGFCDVNYFTKLYKRYYGVSLKKDMEIV